jgi:pimeloyl-ACP methyl ester carboxylesterase
MTTAQPTVVLVHGAFAESASWNAVIERLQAQSVQVIAAPNLLRSISVDAAYVRDFVAALDGPVVLVGHSYGGMVITEVAADNEAVVGLVYVSAYVPESGESVASLSARFPGGTLSQSFVSTPLSTGDTDLTIARADFPSAFAADVPPATAALMAATQRPVTERALGDALPSEKAAWHQVPSWFVYGDADHALVVDMLRFMADRAGARGVREIAGASHATPVSRPDEVVASILDALSATAG